MSTPSPIVLYTLSDATMKGLLPAGYTPLAYIESTGTQYINLTFPANTNTKAEIEFDLTATAADNFILGYGSTKFSLRNHNSVFYINVGAAWNNAASTTATINKKHYVYFDNSKLIFDGVTTTFSEKTYTDTANLAVLGSNTNCKVYSVRIWEGNALKCDLRPAKRDSDEVIGMYDLVSRTFKTNSGSGSFIAGPPLAVGKGGGKSLPEEYLLVEYLESTGGLYINTGYIATNGCKGIVDYMPTKVTDLFVCIIGNHNNDSSNNYERLYIGQRTKWEFGILSTYNRYGTVTVNKRYNLEFSSITSGNGYIKVRNITDNSDAVSNTSVSANNGVTFSSSVPIYLGNSLYGLALSTNTSNALKDSLSAKWYNVKIYNNSSVIVRNMYPCYRKSDMKPGMYDTVNGVFYTNAGSGEFILGPTVTNYYSYEVNASSNGWEHWFDPTEYSIATATYNPLPKIKVIPGKTYILEYDVKAASTYTPSTGAILLEWFTSTSAERTSCDWTGVNIPLTTSYKRISYEWTCPSGLNYVDFGRRASENVAHTIKNIAWKEKNWTSPYPGLYTNVSSIYDSSKGWVADFNGSSSDIQSISNLSQLLSGNIYTISAWVLARSTGNYRGIAGPHLSNTHGFIFGQCSGSSNGISFNGISTTITLNTWIHFVLVNNNGSNSLYKNGELINSNPVSFSTTMLNKPIIVGRAFYSNDRYWDGEITNFLIFNVAFTAEQVKELYGK